MKIKITYESEDGWSFSEITEDDDLGRPYTRGEWTRPFPNSMDESTAFGLEECIMQSDECPLHFFENPIIKIKVEDWKK